MSKDTTLNFSGVFQIGDRVQLTGPKNRKHTISLIPGNSFHSQHGAIAHDDIIGRDDGSVVATTSGTEFLALRPLLSDFVMSMPRGAAIVYPKDAAQIVALADIFPGATVVEAGVGSGALALSLLRAVGESGKLHSFERREEFAEIARANVATFLGALPDNWEVVLGDLSHELGTTTAKDSVDRVVLDMLAPWECLEAVTEALKPGGVVLAYVATATQLSRTVEAIRNLEQYTEPEPLEVMIRGWHVDGLAVRPDHRMIGHTGFLVTARKLAPGTVLPQFRRKVASKDSYSDEDVEIWTPGAVGERSKSAARLRKTVRKATLMAEQKTGTQNTLGLEP